MKTGRRRAGDCQRGHWQDARGRTDIGRRERLSVLLYDEQEPLIIPPPPPRPSTPHPHRLHTQQRPAPYCGGDGLSWTGVQRCVILCQVNLKRRSRRRPLIWNCLGLVHKEKNNCVELCLVNAHEGDFQHFPIKSLCTGCVNSAVPVLRCPLCPLPPHSSKTRGRQEVGGQK